MALRLAALVLALALSSQAFAQEEEVYDNIENVQGDADGFFELFSILQDAAMFGDPVTIAQYANYPLLVNANGESYEILEEQDLLDNFDNLVTPETLQALLEQDVDDLIVTSEGVGIGNGVMWLSNLCRDDSCAETYWGIFSINN